jgi:hypothetical protein
VGEVFLFPERRTCFLCQHHRAGSDSASHCALFDEPIESELFAARHCSSYEPA